jgi:uncharacterized protein YbaP (TraB family)
VPALDEVLVTGQRPGPGMWRVSKSGHELWVLAVLSPLPKKMVWRSTAVEERIAHSQVVLAPPRVEADIGFFRGLTLLPALLRARKTPDDATLEQTLPHDLYIRWLALRVKYSTPGSDEHMRPAVAAVDLYFRALDASGLTSDDAVWDTVEKAARKARVPITQVTLHLPTDDARNDIRSLGQIDRSSEVACLAKTLDRLERDLQPMRQRANLWSLGDVDALRVLGVPEEQQACLDAVLSVPKLRDKLEEARRKLADLWLEAAEHAMAVNSSSFAVLAMPMVLAADGPLENLRAKGYDVEPP